jgi:hypothetical protein
MRRRKKKELPGGMAPPGRSSAYLHFALWASQAIFTAAPY